MGNKRRTAAIFAGLSGCGVWSIPVVASAAPLDMPLGYVDVTMDDLLASPLAYVALGALVGGGVVGIAMGLGRHRATKRLKRQLAEANSAPFVIRVEGPGHVLDLDGSSPRPPERPAQATTSPGPVGGEAETEGDVSAQDEDDGHAEASTTADLGRVHGVLESIPTPAMGRPAHVSRRLDAVLPGFDDVVDSHAPRTRTADVRHDAAHEGAGAPARDGGGAKAATPADTGRPAKARGVRSVLSQRLGGNIMEGIPVIERADGSTADIGTSWWEREVGSTHSFAPLQSTSQLGMKPVDQAPDPMATSELRALEYARAQRNAQAAGLSSAASFGRGLRQESASDRAATIASRIPSFDLSLFPDEGDGESTSGEDMFEQAMRALDAQLPNTSVTTSEDAASITGPISSDLETGYVVSPESLGQAQDADPDVEVQAYVDYLVRDEEERRQNRHHGFLTVFEGTGDLSDAAKATKGTAAAKHLAVLKSEKEA